MRPPTPPGNWLTSVLIPLSRDPLAACARWAAEVGDVVYVPFPGEPIYLVSGPDDIDQVLRRDWRTYVKDAWTRRLQDILGLGLVTSEGELWKRQRKLTHPGFHRDQVAGWAACMSHRSRAVADSWRDGQRVDLHSEMMRLTLGIVAETLFGADIEAEAEEVSAAIETYMRYYLGIGGTGLHWPAYVPSPTRARKDRAIRRLDEVVEGMIRDRRGGSRGADLLGLLMDSVDDDGSGMTDRQLRDEAVTLMLAGHETTAVALTFTFFLLSRHPEVAARLRGELDAVLGDRDPTLADLDHLPYTAHVLHESMRLYPPVWAIGREPLHDVELGGYAIPKGAQIWMSQWAVHRSAAFYPQPDEFVPERWEDGLAHRLPKFAYFPFGGGPRVCIGQRFAQLEAQLVLATLARRWRVDVDPRSELQLLPSVTLRPRRKLPAVVNARRPARQALLSDATSTEVPVAAPTG